MKIIYSVEMGDTHYRIRAKRGNVSMYHYVWHEEWWGMPAHMKLLFLKYVQKNAERDLQL